MRMRGVYLWVVCLAALLVIPAFAGDKTADTGKEKQVERIRAATDVFNEIMSTPDKVVPTDLLSKAECVAIVPSLKKAGFIVGGRYGKGIVTCRNGADNWSAPSMLQVEGGSFGAQIGGQEQDVVMLIMNEKGRDFLFRNKFTVGGELSAAAGPVGRTGAAETDAAMRSELLTYSRSRGLFAGVTLQGASVKPDDKSNHDLYGKDLTAREILSGNTPAPEAAHALLSAIAQNAGAGSHARR